LHSLEREEEQQSGNLISEGVAGWKMLFNAIKRKKPEEQQSQPINN
jgi:hypothetical protein